MSQTEKIEGSIDTVPTQPVEGPHWADNSDWPVVIINEYRNGQWVKIYKINFETHEVEDYSSLF